MLSRGLRYERKALRHLQDRGLVLVTTNYRSRTGEIDLIMRDGDCLVFVEVRFRATRRYGGGSASVDHRKRQRIARTAACYLQSHPGLALLPCRFDVISIAGGESSPDVQWIRSAFDVPEFG